MTNRARLGTFACKLAAALLLSMGAMAATSAADSLGDAVSVEAELLARVQRMAGGPLWVRQGQLTNQARELIGVLRRVEDFGLATEEFAPLVSAIEFAAATGGDPARLEASMNVAALRLIRHLHDGRVDPRLAGYELSRGRAPIDPVATLRHLAASPSPPATLSAVEPRAPQYRALKQMLARYRGMTARPVTPPPENTLIRAGTAYVGAADLRHLLTAFGDLEESGGPASADPRVYDATLARAVARFQRRHALQADGILGPRTMAALAVPIAQRIRQIELTLERWRWLPEMRAPTVIVNVPQFVLYTLPDPAADDPAQTLEIPVIVGQQERQTPVFDSRIEAVVIRP
ncbi:MAG TPA: peptidoglycan-binding protein, partial [Steroidobacteraceae bacterium]|nr:peptidoglycan-binding protein [Steroidobacteraceae bacterium]